jgi:hypothetical protein
MFYGKVKMFCFVVNFFIQIVIKSVKQVECFLFDFFGRNEKGIENLSMGCQTASLFLSFTSHFN